jgi:carboxypeptidase C (cathepsin A)
MKTVYRIGAVLLVALASLFLSPAMRAQEVRSTPVPPEKAVATHHELALGGKTLKYTATAGTLLIRDEEDKPYGSIFYVAYTLDGAERPDAPGELSLQRRARFGIAVAAHGFVFAGAHRDRQPQPDRRTALQAGSQRVLAAGQERPGLHRRAADRLLARRGQGDAKDFTGVDQDLRAFDRFIQRYLNVNQRWNSPKFLIGESYGTTRSAALADMLGNDGVQLNGVVLISSILNYNIRAGGYDTLYISNLPSYAAAAWYFNKIPNKPADLAAWVEQARVFASGPYAQALFAGHNLPAAQLDSVAKEVSRFTGLSVEYVKEANLRISPTRFRKEVLRDDRTHAGPLRHAL